MSRIFVLASGLLALVAASTIAAGAVRKPIAKHAAEKPNSIETGAVTSADEEKPDAPARAAPQSPDEAFAALDAKDQLAAKVYYDAHQAAALWFDASGLTAKGRAVAETLKSADSFGLSAGAYAVSDLPPDATASSATGDSKEIDLALTLAALKYARDARGGRIPDPAAMLNSNLDRRPQWIEPKVILENLVAAPEPGAYLIGLHPKHPQFEKLRALYAAALPPGDTKAPPNAAAKRLRANMEMWRWMWSDMGDLHVLNNIPEFMQYVYKDDKIIRSEKIVAGMIDKQSSVFSRPLKYVVLRPKWRIPESIKVNELWPNLIRGGSMMRQYDLQLETKDGKPLDYHRIEWAKSDIRNYEVTQNSGPKSVLGHVKFSFPSQHTIYMHDTPDKWMFKSAQRTLSHGCLRVKNPMELAEIILKEDKGWDAAKVAELDRSGPMNNEIAMDKLIPIHLVYFTAWVDDAGKLQSFRDVYGHEKRITQALDSDWDKINKGRDHLAPVQPGFNPAAVAARAPNAGNGFPIPRARQKSATVGDIIGDALGLGF